MVKYSCSICRKGYKTLKEAKVCEAQGIIEVKLRPGLTLLKSETPKDKKLYEKIFVILGSRKMKGHDRIYAYGDVTFEDAKGPPEYNFDRWSHGIELSQGIAIKIRDKQLIIPTREQLEEILGSIDSFRGDDDFDIRNQLIQDIERYNIKLHRNY